MIIIFEFFIKSKLKNQAKEYYQLYFKNAQSILFSIQNLNENGENNLLNNKIIHK